MLFVDLRLLPRDLGAQMGHMRVWLDHNNIETAGFSLANGTARVAFRLKLQAEAFARKFGGRTFSLTDKTGNGPAVAPVLVLAVGLAAGQRKIAHRLEPEPDTYALVAADSTVG